MTTAYTDVSDLNWSPWRGNEGDVRKMAAGYAPRAIFLID
jgi:hypothetical protein